MKSQLKDWLKKNKQFRLLSKQMDDRESLFETFKILESRHVFIPAKYKDTVIEYEYEQYKKRGSWRDNNVLINNLRKGFI